MQPLSQVLILLAAAVLLVTLARRLGLPTTLPYLLVGLALGPHALAVVGSTATTTLLAELGVVFLLFTLGLEFALPRLIAMRREVFGLGSAQVTATSAVFSVLARLGGIPWPAGDRDEQHRGGKEDQDLAEGLHGLIVNGPRPRTSPGLS
jgi:monovalent cation:H+ antiporter-2, CPA2 family